MTPAPPDHLPAILRAGDCLLYAPSSVFGAIISVKCWHAISHVEVYNGHGESLASRDPDRWLPKPTGGGVSAYPLRSDHLAAILRPVPALRWTAAREWFKGVKGQGYDWLGLLRFSWRSEYVPAKFTANKMFCSEFATRLYRAAGFDPFPREDADAVAPFEFLTNPDFDLLWSVYGQDAAESAAGLREGTSRSGR